MKEDKNLYFIPILARALDSEDHFSAFQDALTEIIRLGEMPEYKKGFEQFEMFIASGVQSLKDDAKALSEYQDMILDSLLLALALDTLAGSEELKGLLLQRIQDDPQIAKRYEDLCQHLAKEKESEPALDVELYREGELLDSQAYPTILHRTIFTQIQPGRYSLKLSTGWVLWEGTLEEKDLIWNIAFPSVAYPMAATTEIDERSHTKSINLMGGKVELSFHAGLESGSISLILKET
jgi:hypothetical protein